MSTITKSFAGLFGILLLGVTIFLPQAAEARVVCHKGYYLHHHHCVHIHHHRVVHH